MAKTAAKKDAKIPAAKSEWAFFFPSRFLTSVHPETSSGGAKPKSNKWGRFLKTELKKLKEEHPDMSPQDR